MSITTLTKERKAEVNQAIQGMAVEFLHCRDYGHNWRPNTAHRLPKNQGFDEVLRCTTCDTYRHRVLDIFGDVITNIYQYPDGYLIEGLGRLVGRERGLLRIAAVETVIAELAA